MATTYRAKAVVVKVAIGPATGNRVARIIKRGGFIPEGVEQDKLDQLEKLGLIEAVEDQAAGTEAEAKADADAAAAAEAKATADAEAKAKAAAAKTAAAK